MLTEYERVRSCENGVRYIKLYSKHFIHPGVVNTVLLQRIEEQENFHRILLWRRITLHLVRTCNRGAVHWYTPRRVSLLTSLWQRIVATTTSTTATARNP
uniref:Uncharacterized protein n=1 Tax=Lygus hesperus TaxID=30085 RepID=A0A146KXE2_LYGHE